ncbi:hypothetical protein [Yimella sp. cx-51]|uniref:hypothetical protein n=1 Tax=Yimella sp. cx-51 TaxID=2770551 RepID=UPI001FCA97BA|nr:hypothetical protein [Yimella sp. cx-51]
MRQGTRAGQHHPVQSLARVREPRPATEHSTTERLLAPDDLLDQALAELDSRYKLGCGEFEFALEISACGAQSVYVCRDPIHAVGLNLSGSADHDELASQLTPGRHVIAQVGQQLILQNQQGALCLVDLLAVQHEVTQPEYTPASVRFRYRILTGS